MPRNLIAAAGARLALALGVWLLLLGGAVIGAAQTPVPDALEAAAEPQLQPNGTGAEATIKETLIRLPVAAVLGAVLAFRPRRRGTPARDPAVIQTQIILALVGTLVMLVVGASLARAFGIVGAASLIRYRAKVDDPKDAGVMLSCLAIGLAAGVGIYWVAAISTVFMLGVISVLESLEPETRKEFLLRIKLKDEAVKLQPRIEEVFKRNSVKHELRTSSQDDLQYSVSLPLSKKTDRVTNAILELGNKEEMKVEWADRKPSKDAA
jgi:uncharacterized membrane protein YhiD involved in acid resistance